jgi:hypothetical protein
MSEPQKQFGVKVCRERKCVELQKDPEYPDSPEYCQVIGGMPGAMPQCIKEAPPDKFIRRMSSQLNHTFPSPHPGVRNCPKECPYKIEKGTICAFTGEACKEWGVCPCNVLGNEDQENYLKRVLEPTVRVFQKTEPAEILRTCHLHPCPDGMSRCKGGTDCPLIRMPFKDLKVCPLWRIPAKLLAAPVAQIPEKTEKPDTIVVPSPAEMTQKEKTPSRKSSQKEKPTELAEMCRHHKKKGCGIYSGVHDGVDTAKCDGRNPDNWCYVEPVMEKQKRARKEPEETPDERLARGKAIREEVRENREAMKRMSTRSGTLTQEKKRKKKEPAVALRQSTLQEFFSHSKQAEIESAEISSKKRSRIDKPSPDIKAEPAACRDCHVSPCCENHDPHAGCENEALKSAEFDRDCIFCAVKMSCKHYGKPANNCLRKDPAPEPFVQHCCWTCGHHKGRKTFHDSCPRLGELLFKGGTKSAKVLMDETAATPCGYWTDIPGDLYVPEKIQDCFGKLCDQITGTAGCENCADHEACHKEPARLKRSVKK